MQTREQIIKEALESFYNTFPDLRYQTTGGTLGIDKYYEAQLNSAIDKTKEAMRMKEKVNICTEHGNFVSRQCTTCQATYFVNQQVFDQSLQEKEFEDERTNSFR